MKSFLSMVNNNQTKGKRIAFMLLLAFFLMPCVCESRTPEAEKVLSYLKGLGNGRYMFGQMATWVHNENPDMDHPSNWLKKVYDHTGKIPRYGCVTYDFHDDPFPDSAWNDGVKKMWDRGLIVGVFTFYANPAGRSWNGPVDIDPIFEAGDNPTKDNFYKQMDRMANNLQWLKARGIPVVYTPFVESDDRNKWHAKEGPENIIKLYRLVHDYFTNDKGLDNIIWAYHTTANHGALEKYYPGDAYVDVLGKSAYGTGLNFSEYRWALEKKKKAGKVIWWSELGIRGRKDTPRNCLDVVKKLESSYPELAGFVFWSDDGHYNVLGNDNGPELMAHPKIVTLEDKYAVSVGSGGTTVSIDETQWRINGKITHPGTAAEGLLMNVRMVNSTFEDGKRTDFDSDENTSRFISKIPEYNSCGVRAFTLNLQGGFPGYEGAVNSAFRPDGTLRKKYLGRIKRVIEECDKRGMVVILGLFYQRQDQILHDEQAVKRAVVNAVNWVKENSFTNVVIEVANEYDHGGFDHDIIKTAKGEVELIRLVKKTVPGLPVSTSGLGHGRMNGLVAKEADFILIHFNGTKVEDIPKRIGALKKYNKPIVCNEDDKVGDEAVLALQACVDNGCSWGFMHNKLNQYEPFEFNGYDDDRKVYDKFKQITTK